MLSLCVSTFLFGVTSFLILVLVVPLSIGGTIGVVAMNVCVLDTRGDIPVKQAAAFALYIILLLAGLGLATIKHTDPKISVDAVHALHSFGWSFLISFLAGLMHLALLRNGVIFLPPQPDPPMKSRPRLVK